MQICGTVWNHSAHIRGDVHTLGSCRTSPVPASPAAGLGRIPYDQQKLAERKK